VYCQIVYLRDCHPGRIRHAVAHLPDTLDLTYERTLREINKAASNFAHRLFQCVAAASRPLRVEELAEFLAFEFETGPIPKFHEDRRPEDPLETVLSTCSTLLCLINIDDFPVIQFSHFSVKEFLTSPHFAGRHDILSRCYHVSMSSAHTLVAQACLGILLHLDENITRDSLVGFPLAEYAAKHWVEHAHFGGVSQDTTEGIKQLFDPSRPHLAAWVWIHDPWSYELQQYSQAERPSPPRGTPLHYAAFCGFHTIVQFLVIERSQDVHSRRVHDDSTPLHLALQQGHVEVARVLVNHGAKVSAKDQDGWTPLHLASKHGHADLARLLIEHGAKVSAKDKQGCSPLHMALEDNHVDLARILAEHGANVSAKDNSGVSLLHQALQYNRLAFVQVLVGHGADMPGKWKDGSTPLNWVLKQGYVDLARILVEHGANVSGRDSDGVTPLHLAAQTRNLDLAQFLVERGAKVSAKDSCGWTPLHQASFNGHVDSALFLIEHGVNVSAKDKGGWTPLHQALSSGHTDFARCLVEHGADVSTKDPSGETPLHRVSSRGHVGLAQVLVEHGANVSARNQSGETPLHRASSHGHVDLVQFLVERGADVSARDKFRLTPLHQASKDGQMYDHVRQFLITLGADTTAQALPQNQPPTRQCIIA
jgi:ankyrin repeat protein